MKEKKTIDYYSAAIDELDQKIQAYLKAHPYPAATVRESLFQPTKEKLPNSEAIAHYEYEVDFIDHTIKEFGSIIEPHGLILTPEENGHPEYTVRYMPSSCPRISSSSSSPFLPLSSMEYADARAAMKDYLIKLGESTPVFPSVVQMNQVIEQLLEFRKHCKHSLAGLDKGERGENLVLENLQKVGFKYIVLSSVVLPAITGDSQTSETDAYVITPKGIFVLEIKNKGNENVTFSISKDGRWEEKRHGRVTHTYGQTPYDKSPSEQNIIHKINTEAFLESHGFKDIPMYPVVVFANNDVDIENDSHDVVLRSSALISYIESINDPPILSREKMEEIAKLIDENRMEARAFDVLSLSCNMTEMYQNMEHLLHVFYEQKQAEIEIGKMLEDAVAQIMAGKDNVAKLKAEQVKTSSVRFGKNTVLNIFRCVLLFIAYYIVQAWIEDATWFKRILSNSGYLRSAHSYLGYITDMGVLFGIWIAIVVGAWLISWLVPHLVWQNLKQKSKAYLLDTVVNVLVLIALYIVILIVLAKGMWQVALAGFAILLFLSWKVWSSKFLICVGAKV